MSAESLRARSGPLQGRVTVVRGVCYGAGIQVPDRSGSVPLQHGRADRCDASDVAQSGAWPQSGGGFPGAPQGCPHDRTNHAAGG